MRVLIHNTNPIIKNELDKLAPLVLTDGIQIQDFSLLANLNPARVDFVDIVPQQYCYGPKIFGGIVAVSTKENDFKLPENSVNSLNFELLASIKTADFEPKTYQNTTDLNEYQTIEHNCIGILRSLSRKNRNILPFLLQMNERYLKSY